MLSGAEVWESCTMKEFPRERRAKRSGIPSQGGSMTSRRHEQLVVAETHRQLVELRASHASEEEDRVSGNPPVQQRKTDKPLRVGRGWT